MSAQYGVTTSVPLASFTQRMRQVTPATLGATAVNNYAPSDAETGLNFFEAQRIRQATNASGSTITGLDASDIADGQFVIVENLGPGTLTLTHESTASLIANRFTLPGAANLPIDVGSATMLVYDGTTSRFRLAAGGVGAVLDGSVTLSKLADISTARVIGRTTAGTGEPEELTGTQATALLDAFTAAAKGLAPASGGGTLNFLRADGMWSSPPGVGLDTMISVKAAPYSAVGDGAADDTVAIQAAIDAAIAANKPVYFPKGTYKITQAAATYGGNPYCLLVHDTSKFSIVGDQATITHPSQSAYGIMFYNTVANITVAGMRFQGANDDNTATNNRGALYFTQSGEDVTIHNCDFTWGPGIQYGSDGVLSGRMICTNNRFHDTNGALSCPYRSIIVNNIFDSSTKPGGRTHYIYISGPADACTIVGNVFRRSDSRSGTYAIQIRAGTSRYNYKHSYTITGNQFFECSGCMWLGSDDAVNVASFTISGNNFFDSTACVRLMGCRNASVTGNTAEFSYQFTPDSTGAFEANYVSGVSSTDGVVFTGNTVVNRHPFYGTITIGALPTAGDTITIGTQVYTWRAAAALSGEVTIGATTRLCANALAEEIRGNGLTPVNKVLRDQTDALNSLFSYDGSNTNDVIVVSHTTFTLSRVGAAVTVSAVSDHRNILGAAFLLIRSRWAKVADNFIQDVYLGISSTGGMAPVIENNTLAGSYVMGHGNVLSVWRNNTFRLSPTREATQPAPDRFMQIDDGFTVIDGNGYGQVVGNEYETIAAHGYGGTVPVGDGKARVWMYYGVENLQGGSGQPTTLHWRWSDGDAVKISDGATTYTCTFKRAAPGANEFNTADTLVAWINGSTGGTYSAAYVPYVIVGGTTPDPKLMIEVKHAAGGATGNSHFIQVQRTGSDDGLDTRALRMCGVLLIDRRSTVAYTDRCNFQGGSAAADKTVIWSPVASSVRGVFAHGVDATAHALAPVVYRADITPGVCAVISHSVAAGTEEFFYRVG